MAGSRAYDLLASRVEKPFHQGLAQTRVLRTPLSGRIRNTFRQLTAKTYSWIGRVQVRSHLPKPYRKRTAFLVYGHTVAHFNLVVWFTVPVDTRTIQQIRFLIRRFVSVPVHLVFCISPPALSETVAETIILITNNTSISIDELCRRGVSSKPIPTPTQG